MECIGSECIEAFPVPALLQQHLSGKNVLVEEHVALREQLDRLIGAQQNRDKACSEALADLQLQYDSIIQKAKSEAAKIVADASQQASLTLADATTVQLTATSKAAQAEATAKQITDKARKDAEIIVQNAEATGKSVEDITAAKCKKMEEAVAAERARWKAEKDSVADIQKFQSIVKINVGGNRFDTSLTTLTRFPDTMIGTMFNGRHTLVLDAEGYHFIDRDGTHFRYILNYLRSPEAFEVDLPSVALKELQNECKYYGLYDVMFPWKPVPPFKVKNSADKNVEVVQGPNRVYYINSVPVRVCTSCERGEYGTDWGTYVEDFCKAVRERKGTIYRKQPTTKPSECQECEDYNFWGK